MTRERLIELLTMQAFAEGYDVQCKRKSEQWFGAQWFETTDPDWNRIDLEFRIAPPQEWWFLMSPKGEFSGRFKTEEDAKHALSLYTNLQTEGYKPIHLREVLENE